MSYGFNMLFCEAANLGQAMCIAKDFVKRICTKEKMEKEIRENLYYIPSIRERAKPEDKVFCRTADHYWLYGLFNYRFVYWEKYQLLGLLSEERNEWPASAKSEGAYSVYFQNSCDQDYEFTEWPTFIPFFAKAVQEYQRLVDMPAEKVQAYIKKQGGTLLQDEDDEEDNADNGAMTQPIQETKFLSRILAYSWPQKDHRGEKRVDSYYIRSALYDYIFRTLDLNAWLYGHESDIFERFAINGLETSEMLMDTSEYLNAFVNKQLDRIYNKKSIAVPVVISGSSSTFLYRYVYEDSDDMMTTEKVKATLNCIVREYLETKEGKKLAQEFNGNVPYEELLSTIPAHYFAKHQLHPMKERDYLVQAVTFAYGESYTAAN